MEVELNKNSSIHVYIWRWIQMICLSEESFVILEIKSYLTKMKRLQHKKYSFSLQRKDSWRLIRRLSILLSPSIITSFLRLICFTSCLWSMNHALKPKTLERMWKFLRESKSSDIRMDSSVFIFLEIFLFANFHSIVKLRRQWNPFISWSFMTEACKSLILSILKTNQG